MKKYGSMKEMRAALKAKAGAAPTPARRYVARLRDASPTAAVTYIKAEADGWGITLVESMAEATRWADPALAWRYAEIASTEFGMAYIAEPERDPFRVPWGARGRRT